MVWNESFNTGQLWCGSNYMLDVIHTNLVYQIVSELGVIVFFELELENDLLV